MTLRQRWFTRSFRYSLDLGYSCVQVLARPCLLTLPCLASPPRIVALSRHLVACHITCTSPPQLLFFNPTGNTEMAVDGGGTGGLQPLVLPRIPRVRRHHRGGLGRRLGRLRGRRGRGSHGVRVVGVRRARTPYRTARTPHRRARAPRGRNGSSA